MLLKFTTLVVSAVCGWACLFGWYSLAKFRYTRFCNYAAVLLPFIITPVAAIHCGFDHYSWNRVGWLVVAAFSYLPAFIAFGGVPEHHARWDMPIINLTQVFVFGLLAQSLFKKPWPQTLFIAAGAIGSILLAYLVRWVFRLDRR